MTNIEKKNNTYNQQQQNEQQEHHRPMLNDFDLNVVDEALLHPDIPEYEDHFGFIIQVSSDHEYDSSDVSSLEDKDDCNIEDNELGEDGENNTISTKNTTLSSSSSSITDDYRMKKNVKNLTGDNNGETSNISEKLQQQYKILDARNALDNMAPTNIEEMTNLNTTETCSLNEKVDESAPNKVISNSARFESGNKVQEDWQIVNKKPQEDHQAVRTPSPTASAPSSTAITDTAVSATPTAETATATTSYYEMLLSKFRRRECNKSISSNSNSVGNTQKQTLTLLKKELCQNLEQLKEECNDDIDWDFCASLICNFEKAKRTEQAKIRRFLAIGIPPPLRGKLWRIFSNSDDDNYLNDDTHSVTSTVNTTKTDNELVVKEYIHLLNQTSPCEKLIRRDLSRTFPHIPFFKDKEGEGQEMLFNVMKAYSLFDTHVGYCQGLHFVVGVLLLHMPDEAAFCVLIKLMSQYGLRGNFTPQMETLHERMYQFGHLLQTYLPEIHRHLDAQGVLPSMYASQWFMTLYAYRCPLELVYRVFDLLFVEGPSILLSIALALMKKNQSVILSLEFESLLEFLSGGSSNSNSNNSNSNSSNKRNHNEHIGSIFDAYSNDRESGAYQFVQDAYEFVISPKLLAKLAKQYQIEAAKEAKLQSIEDAIKRENVQLTDQIQRIRIAYKALERDHQDVTQHVIQSKVAIASLDAENQQLRHEIKIMKQEMVKMKNSYSSANTKYKQQFEQLAKQNAHLVEANSDLENKVAELEAVLIDMKIKYAESESEYEMMRQKLQEAQRLSNVSSHRSSSASSRK
ncbi:rab-GTPase-TBC domain-containing protein [Mycotypha africana]|uniref:rab-GTPase-TBC domain-containing protein n=1 Tax=Mycotypha africana TaxID=64632 RepID=UPI00230182FF|nr:rab-GTPase-TBC domain-containing protein [Mycotypha africana]KAI8984727.1 rab-GTPase-TBC domain-containing protein [Mycotypha africana]